MKFTIAREKLLEPLQLTSGVVERRQTSPCTLELTAQSGAGQAGDYWNRPGGRAHRCDYRRHC